MQWMQDPSQNNIVNLTKVRRDDSRHLRSKKKAYRKAKIEELETNSKLKNVKDLYRGINNFKKGYQPRTSIVKDEQGDLVVDSHSILVRWRNYFAQKLNVHGVNDVRQAEIHTAELLVPQLGVSEFEFVIEKPKSHK
jgi:UDP:flavonoid glycosyltransferase YjiC (YdhE family)